MTPAPIDAPAARNASLSMGTSQIAGAATQRPEVPADQDTDGLADHATSPFDDATDRRSAVSLEHPRTSNGTDDREQRGPRYAWCAGGPEPGCPATSDECGMRERLDVLHEGWQPVDATLERTRRYDAWLRQTARRRERRALSPRRRRIGSGQSRPR